MTFPYNDTNPFTKIYDVTPSDSVDLDPPARSLFLGTAGDIKITTVEGTTATMVNHPAGYLVGEVTRVWATGTTADDINALV